MSYTTTYRGRALPRKSTCTGRALVLGFLIAQIEEQTDQAYKNHDHQDHEGPRLHEVHTVPSFLGTDITWSGAKSHSPARWRAFSRKAKAQGLMGKFLPCRMPGCKGLHAKNLVFRRRGPLYDRRPSFPRCALVANPGDSIQSIRS